MSLRSSATQLLSRAGITLDGTAPYDPRITDESVLRDTFIWGSLGLGDAYMDGKWECDALDVFFEKVLAHGLEHRIGMGADRLLALREKVMNLQSVRRALQVAEHHYDLGNALYEELLGQSMAYSSAYFGSGAQDLTQAQEAKFDLICRKLGLEKGMKVLEIGCGWGTFAAYAAKNYGVEILGVTVSKEQLAYAKKVCADLPVTFFFGDYRTLPKELEGTFDRAVSIEMIEAVGTKNLDAYMDVARRMLSRDGAFLVQAIMGNGIPDVWLSTRIFPNGVLPSLHQIADAIEGKFRLDSYESFGKDYDRTLMLWDERFRTRWETIKDFTGADGTKLYDDRFYRMWRYYLCVCAGAFRVRKIDVAHILLSKVGVLTS